MRKLVIFILLLIINRADSQNLVPNPSFEDTVGGTPCYGAIEGAKFWFNPHGATPDFYTFFPNYCGSVSSINNPSGFQLPRTGNAYAGIYSIISPSRDYIAVALSDTLIAGTCYFAEMYCSLANLSRYATDRLGMYFTDDTTGMKLYTTNIPVIPQVENISGNFLSDTMSWMHISESFAASGGETFLIIGNFYDDQNTALDTLLSQSSWQAAYYYIDDIAVVPCDSVSSVDDIRFQKQIILYPNPAKDWLTVSFKNAIIDLRYLELINSIGKHVSSALEIDRTLPYEIKINISNLSPGIYHLLLLDIKHNMFSLRFHKI